MHVNVARTGTSTRTFDWPLKPLGLPNPSVVPVLVRVRSTSPFTQLDP